MHTDQKSTIALNIIQEKLKQDDFSLDDIIEYCKLVTVENLQDRIHEKIVIRLLQDNSYDETFDMINQVQDQNTREGLLHFYRWNSNRR